MYLPLLIDVRLHFQGIHPPCETQRFLRTLFSLSPCVSEGTTNHAELAVVQAVVQKVEEVVCKSIEDMTQVADSVEILRRTQPKKRRRLETEVDMTT